MKKLLLLPVLLVMISCSSLFTKNADLDDTYKINSAAVKNWDKTISDVVKKESLIEDWYGNENPVYYLRKTNIINEKDYAYLTSLKDMNDIGEKNINEFGKLLKKYTHKLKREFWLKEENIKDPKGLAEKMVKEANLRIKTPSNYILNNVATGKEKDLLVSYAGKKELTKKEVKKLRKLLNSFVSREEFFTPENWYNREVSPRLMTIVDISKKEKVSKLERNNINAKALYIAYPAYFSELEKWKK